MRGRGPGRSPLTVRIAAVGLGLLLTPNADLTAQVIRGRLIDAVDESAIAQADVRVTRGQDLVGEARTGADGAFEVLLPSSGRYSLGASALGYQPLVEANIEVGVRELVEVTVRLSASPIPMERSPWRRAVGTRGMPPRTKGSTCVGQTFPAWDRAAWS